jgi:hypothetical protein
LAFCRIAVITAAISLLSCSASLFGASMLTNANKDSKGELNSTCDQLLQRTKACQLLHSRSHWMNRDFKPSCPFSTCYPVAVCQLAWP